MFKKSENVISVSQSSKNVLFQSQLIIKWWNYCSSLQFLFFILASNKFNLKMKYKLKKI